MAKQRNNVMKLPFEARKRVCEMLFDAAAYESIRKTVRSEFGVKLSLHNSSLLAYSKSEEYAAFKENKRKWGTDAENFRWAAAAVNEGKGVESAADLAEMLLMKQLKELASTGCSDIDEARKLASAISSVVKARNSQRIEKLASENESLKLEIKSLTEKILEKQGSAAGLSEETIRIIEEKAGIL